MEFIRNRCDQSLNSTHLPSSQNLHTPSSCLPTTLHPSMMARDDDSSRMWNKAKVVIILASAFVTSATFGILSGFVFSLLTTLGLLMGHGAGGPIGACAGGLLGARVGLSAAIFLNDIGERCVSSLLRRAQIERELGNSREATIESPRIVEENHSSNYELPTYEEVVSSNPPPSYQSSEWPDHPPPYSLNDLSPSEH